MDFDQSPKSFFNTSTDIRDIAMHQLSMVHVLCNAESHCYKWDENSHAFWDEMFINNPSSCTVGFKLKRTSPKHVHVSPPFGILDPQDTKSIKISITLDDRDADSLLEENYLKVLVCLITDNPRNPKDIWQSDKKPSMVSVKKIPLNFTFFQQNSIGNSAKEKKCPCCESTEETGSNRAKKSTTSDTEETSTSCTTSTEKGNSTSSKISSDRKSSNSSTSEEESCSVTSSEEENSKSESPDSGKETGNNQDIVLS